MLVTWEQVEAKAQKAMTTAVQKTIKFTESRYASSYSGYSRQLSSTGMFMSEFTHGGLSATGTVTPIASPRPSVFGQPTIGGSLAEMMEYGYRMDLKKFFRTRDKTGRQPRVQVREKVQTDTNSYFYGQLRQQFIKNGFTL